MWNVTYLAQQASDANSSWITIGLLVASIAAINWRKWTGNGKVGPFTKIATIALAMGILGILLSLVKWEWFKDFANMVAGWIRLGEDSSLIPLICIVVSVGMRTAQVFQGADGAVKNTLDKIPDIIEDLVIVAAAIVGGISMAGSPAWKEWFEAWGEAVKAFVEVGKKGIDLIPIF